MKMIEKGRINETTGSQGRGKRASEIKKKEVARPNTFYSTNHTLRIVS